MAITIIKQPTNIAAVTGSTVRFSVEAAGDSLTYQWEFKNTSVGEWGASGMTGNKTPSMSVEVTKARNGYQYRCKITDANGETLTSDAAVLIALDELAEIGFMSSQTMTAIADAIRAKTETSDKILPADMAGLIEGLERYKGLQILEGTARTSTTTTSTTSVSLGVQVPYSDYYVFLLSPSNEDYSDSSTTVDSTFNVMEWRLGSSLSSIEMHKKGDYLYSNIDTTSILTFESPTVVTPVNKFKSSTTYSWRYIYV